MNLWAFQAAGTKRKVVHPCFRGRWLRFVTIWDKGGVTFVKNSVIYFMDSSLKVSWSHWWGSYTHRMCYELRGCVTDSPQEAVQVYRKCYRVKGGFTYEWDPIDSAATCNCLCPSSLLVVRNNLQTFLTIGLVSKDFWKVFWCFFMGHSVYTLCPR